MRSRSPTRRSPPHSPSRRSACGAPAFADVAYEDFAHGEAGRLEELPARPRDAARRQAPPWRACRGSGSSRWPTSIRSWSAAPGAAMLALYRRVVRWTRSSATRPSGAISTRSPAGARPAAASSNGRSSGTTPASSSPSWRWTPAWARCRFLRIRSSAASASRAARAAARRSSGAAARVTGAGGKGKTRPRSRRLREARLLGTAALVELAPLRDPELVAPTIGQALGLAEVAGEAATDTLGGRAPRAGAAARAGQRRACGGPAAAELVARAPPDAARDEPRGAPRHGRARLSRGAAGDCCRDRALRPAGQGATAGLRADGREPIGDSRDLA